MKVDYFAAVVYDGGVYCTGCLHEVEAMRAEPIFAGQDEWDSYPVCSECGEEHSYVSLTDYGTVYEAGRIAGLDCQDAEKLAGAGTVHLLGRELLTMAQYIMRGAR